MYRLCSKPLLLVLFLIQTMATLPHCCSVLPLIFTSPSKVIHTWESIQHLQQGLQPLLHPVSPSARSQAELNPHLVRTSPDLKRCLFWGSHNRSASPGTTRDAGPSPGLFRRLCRCFLRLPVCYSDAPVAPSFHSLSSRAMHHALSFHPFLLGSDSSMSSVPRTWTTMCPSLKLRGGRAWIIKAAPYQIDWTHQKSRTD